MEPKKYSLKPLETQLLKTTIDQHGIMMSNLVSFIGIERLAINVTQNTRFSFNEDLTEITVTEEQPEAPDTGVVTDTVKAKK